MRQKKRTTARIMLICGTLAALSSGSAARSQNAPEKPASSTAGNPAGTASANLGRWSMSVGKTDKGKPQVEIRLAANEPYTDADATDQKTADFVIGCTTGQTLAFIDWKGPLVGENNDINSMTISVSLDDSPPGVSTWDVSSENTSLISRNSVDFVKNLAGKKRMEIQVQPDGMNEQTVVFSLSNLDDVLKVIGEQCYK